jgi:hypothetical protein
MRRKRRMATGALAVLVLVAASAAVVTARPDAAQDDRLMLQKRFAELAGIKGAVPWGTNGLSSSGEAEVNGNGPAQQEYENRAYPAGAVAHAQTLTAIKAAKAAARRAGAKLPSKWELVGSDTLEVGQLGTQHFGAPTQWSGRISAMAVDSRHCNASACKLYVGAAGGGVWVTNNALAQRANWRSISTGLDTTSIGTLAIDPNDTTGNTLYVGTGEPNGASENEAGLGLYKSTNGGNSWSLVEGSVAATKDRGIGGLVIDPTNPNHILIGTAVARHGASAVSGGRFTPPGAPRLGLYESTNGGQSFTRIFERAQDPVNPATPNGSDFFRGGITDLEWDPNHASTFYFTMFNEGVFRSTGGAITQIFTEPNPDGPGGLGIRYQIATADLPSGKTRIYLGQGSNEVGAEPFADASKMWRTDDSRAASVSWLSLSNNVPGQRGYDSWDFCRTQCSYDMPVSSPPGRPDEVWIGGAMQYEELPTRNGFESNGRAVLRSVNAGLDWTDMSGDLRPDPVWEGIHPDIHEIHFAPSGVAFIGSDGGVERTNGTYVDSSAKCDARPIPTPAKRADCKRWLSAIPERLIPMNDGLSTLQFQNIAVDPTDPLNDLLGGTQDNGTPGMLNGTWSMVVQGDGGPASIDVDGTTRMHTYSGPYGDVNFAGNVQGQWLWNSDPLIFANLLFGEGAGFYSPLISDPAVSKTMLIGLQRVWRTKKAGGDRAFLEANCNTNTGALVFTGLCGDWVPLGGAVNTAGDLAGPFWGLDKGGNAPAGNYVAAIERAAGDTGTMWAATRRGRLFISENADAEPGTAVTYRRIDTPSQPQRFISGIAIDELDRYHAYVSFSGYDAYTPGQPGHVFEVRYNPATGTATWTDVSHDLGDQPVTDVEYDSATGDLYAATDFGVLRLVGTSWTAAADGLPPVAVYDLTLAAGKHSAERVLYAATHGRSIWRTELPKAKG